ncbi:trichome birefringence-like protein 2 [Tanacetum coccineum]
MMRLTTKPEVVPLEKSGSVSTSELANNVIVTPRFSKKPLTSYKRKDSKLKDTSTGSPPNAETKAVNDPVNANDLSANQRDPKKIGYEELKKKEHKSFQDYNKFEHVGPMFSKWKIKTKKKPEKPIQRPIWPAPLRVINTLHMSRFRVCDDLCKHKVTRGYQDLNQSKAESNSNVSSRAAVPERPKVLAPGLYAMTPKYSSNDMVHNHYLEKAKKQTHEIGRNSKSSVIPSARSQSIANGSKPKPRINNQKQSLQEKVNNKERADIQATGEEKTDEEFTEAENNKERPDIKLTNILSKKALQDSFFTHSTKTETSKEIWENVELLMQVHQRNTKFVNNLPSYWGKYVTIVKNSKDISTMSYVDLYTHLKSYEQHAMKTLSKMNQTSGNADPLAYMAQATHSTSSPSQYVPPPPQYAPAPQQAPQSTNDAMLATMNQIVNLLSGFQKQFPPTNNQLRTSTNPKTQATIQAGQITTENVQRRAPGNKGKHAATGSQGKVVTCYNCRGQGHVARECKEKKRAKDS